MKDQKGEYVTPCDEQLCERESSQARQMDRGEIEVEERAKSVPVLWTDKEKDESEIMHMTTRSQCENEDPHKRSPKESLVPRVTMDRGPFAHGVYTDPVLIQDPQCGGNLPSASRKFRDSCSQWCAGKP